MKLYIDTKKQCYKDLGFKRLTFFNLFPALFARSSRDAMNKAKKDKIEGDFKGDGMQNGGLLVVAAGGKTLLSFKQDNPSDQVDPNEILKILQIQDTVSYPVLDKEGTNPTEEVKG